MRITQVRGIPLAVHEDEALSNAIVRDRDFFEAEILDYIRDIYPKQETIFDVGANIGNHTVYFANYLEYKEIWAFEPYWESFTLLDYNTKEYSNIHCSNVAISDQGGQVYLLHNRENFGATEVTIEKNEWPVECVTLDGFEYIKPRVSLLKIDVEFWEPHVIWGGQKFLKRHRPLILIEDAKDEYGALLPNYRMVKAWPQHITYLYEWSD